ncbi:MAG: DNA-formamidopyrimidine glycosylase [Candidatus Omnitrophota bacterium]
MPELPEVETMTRDLRKKIIGSTVDDIAIYDHRVIKDVAPPVFIRRLKGRNFTSVERRGKGIILKMDNGSFLFVQVKMTGYFVYGPNLKENNDSKETKVIFRLSNGKFLNYNDQRLFGWLILVDRLEDIPYLNTIGPEPLGDEFSVDWFYRQLKNKTSPIKPLLMNQQFIAGIGNIYASEILFSAGVHPEKTAGKLTKIQVERIHWSTIKVLEESIKFRGTSMRNYRDSSGKKGRYLDRIKIYGKEHKECPVCDRPIKRIVQAQRSTFFCEQCQK